jgi:hypothetical protein
MQLALKMDVNFDASKVLGICHVQRATVSRYTKIKKKLRLFAGQIYIAGLKWSKQFESQQVH